MAKAPDTELPFMKWSVCIIAVVVNIAYMIFQIIFLQGGEAYKGNDPCIVVEFEAVNCSKLGCKIDHLYWNIVLCFVA